MAPKISIITVSFNSEKTIEETILSVINQKYTNFEYIIIDGGSTDCTLDIVDKYRDRISVIISEKDNGISDAFNKGIKLSTGDLIGLINSDDLLTDDALVILASNYDRDVDVYRGNTIMWNDKTGYKCIDIPTMYFPIVPIKLHVCHQSTFICKKSYERFGMYKVDFKYMMDLDLLIRYCKFNARFMYINHELAIFRLGGVSQVSETVKMTERKQLVLSNGGNYFQVILFQLYLVLRQIIKKTVGLFGEDFRLKIINH